MPIIRKLIITMTAAAALLTVPSAAFASPASPAAVTRAANPVSNAKPADPGCSLKLGKPNLLRSPRRADVTGMVTCKKTVQRLVLGVALARNGKVVAKHGIVRLNVKSLRLPVRKACRNHNRGSFTGGAAYQVTYRGHTFPIRAKGSGPVALACGF